MLATNAEVEEVVYRLALATGQLMAMLLVDDLTEDSSCSSTQTKPIAGEGPSIDSHSSKFTEANGPSDNTKRSKQAPKQKTLCKVGDRMVVTQKDKYHGGQGTVVNK